MPRNSLSRSVLNARTRRSSNTLQSSPCQSSWTGPSPMSTRQACHDLHTTTEEVETPTSYRTRRDKGTSCTPSDSIDTQQIICAIAESRGISKTIGLAFLNLSTSEAVLSQVNDTQAYVRTVHQVAIFQPSCLLTMSTAVQTRSPLLDVLKDTFEDLDNNIVYLDRPFWSENTGTEYLEQLAFEDVQSSIATTLSGNFYAICAFSAVCKYLETRMGRVFGRNCLRVSFQPPDGSMMIDTSTLNSLELLQNLNDHRSKQCMIGVLDQTQSPMGSRLMRSNLLQPLTDVTMLNARYDAVDELSTKEDQFLSVRSALKTIPDVERLLTCLNLTSTDQHELQDTEQAINNVLLLKQFLAVVPSVREALAGCQAAMLESVYDMCDPVNLDQVRGLIDEAISEDTTYARKPLDLQNQRTFAVKSGMNGFLDVARQTYKESTTDAIDHIADLSRDHNLPYQTKYARGRLFFIRIHKDDFGETNLPSELINICRKKDFIECQTVELLKRNQKISAAHNDVLIMSDQIIRDLICELRKHMSILFKTSEAIATLDLLSSLAHLVTTGKFVRPVLDTDFAITGARHPIFETAQGAKFIPNDIFATQQSRFQIITGCNMSGKSTYTRMVALLTVMAQIGSFVPAEYAVMPVVRQLFARVSLDDSIEANVSTFAAEMRETAFVLRNLDAHSLVIIDELGRGTSTRDGLAIAVAIAEALIQSRARVWFATHFRELAHVLSERSGVVSLHLTVDASSSRDDRDEAVRMLYRVAPGVDDGAHRGLRLARAVVVLPDGVLDRAEFVANVLEQRGRARQAVGQSLAIIRARRRRLLLQLREHLDQARRGQLYDDSLADALYALQGEFVGRMAELDREARDAQDCLGGADTQQSATDGFDMEICSLPERQE